MNFDVVKYNSLLEDVRNTLNNLVGPLAEGVEVIAECGPDCDCEPCKKEFHDHEKDEKEDVKEEGKKFWIQKAIKNPGALHKKTHTPAGEKISAKKLNKAAHSKNPTTRKEVALAKTLKKLHKK